MLTPMASSEYLVSCSDRVASRGCASAYLSSSSQIRSMASFVSFMANNMEGVGRVINIHCNNHSGGLIVATVGTEHMVAYNNEYAPLDKFLKSNWCVSGLYFLLRSHWRNEDADA